MRYLTGFEGSSAWVLLTPKKNIFITDFRYKEDAERLLAEDIWELFIYKESLIKTIYQLCKKLNIKRLAVESSVSYEFYISLQRIGLTLTPLYSVVERMRSIKDEEEVRLIKEAIRRAEDAFMEVLYYIKPGQRERGIALRLEEVLKKGGCRNLPFDIIVASGPNSSMPHAKPTERKIMKGDLVIIDWGGEAEGYYCDMTRTVLINGGDISKKIEMYEAVLMANKEAIKGVSPEIRARKVDEIARKIIKKRGFGDYFGHGTGHGVGLQVHETPVISPKSKDRLKTGMVFTIEPGVYIPGFGGIRIEDMVYMTPKGSEVLTGLSKELKII